MTFFEWLIIIALIIGCTVLILVRVDGHSKSPTGIPTHNDPPWNKGK